MLALFDDIIHSAPEWEKGQLVSTPISAILDWPMGTMGGLATFLNPKVNEMFLKMFKVWAAYLDSPDSRYVLTKEENGWFGPAASAALPDFIDTFVCDPDAPYYGFASWDKFFTRTFRPGVRPVQWPDNDDIINNACESTRYRIARSVQPRDSFWLKGEPYSLYHMLNNDPLQKQFVGGTVYQAFLSALNYHRWHSPVNGTVVKAVLVPGSYYAEAPSMGFANPKGPDPSGPVSSQAFLTAVATRALIFIQANNPRIGLMCLMAVGMAEVSTCEIGVEEGQKVKKGEEIGMFHFGGSTYCLIFRPETNVTFVEDYPADKPVLLNVALATVND
jgi:phosphatidylserine decarboxylase